jgi:putative intracellular protease/amidase
VPSIEERTVSVYLLVFEGFADWEPSYALAELRRSGRRDVVTVGYGPEPVRSMGGLRILPDHVLDDVRPESVDLLILPGGDRWEATPIDPRLAGLLERLVRLGRPIAAICGATVAMARAGLLQDRAHTSNGLAYLRQAAPEYAGSAGYREAPAVTDRGLITASGLGAVEFAREIFAALGVFSREDLELWYRAFRLGEMPA